jgi:hypothetical protein
LEEAKQISKLQSGLVYHYAFETMIHQILSYAVFSFCYFPAKIEVGK